jgi:PPOX class probable F420-dependent enzyme
MRALLDGPNFGHVASVLPDGAPHSVPVWIALEDDRIVFFTQSGSRKARNLERDPRVAISVVDGVNPYRNVQIRGRVVERRTGDPAEEVIERLARKFTGEPFPWRSPNSVLYVVEPERVRLTELPFVHRPD